MKRNSLIRRRRYLLGAALCAAAVAALLPQAALARPDEWVVSDPYATDSTSAEDAHGLSAGAGFVLPAGDQTALDLAKAAAVSGLRADDFAPPRNVAVADASTASSANWGQVGLISGLGAFMIGGVLLLTLFLNRRGTRIALP